MDDNGAFRGVCMECERVPYFEEGILIGVVGCIFGFFVNFVGNSVAFLLLCLLLRSSDWNFW